MSSTEAALTIVSLLDQLYDVAWVPEHMEPCIPPDDLNQLLSWQSKTDISKDDARVLTIEKLNKIHPISLLAFQMFAFNAMLKMIEKKKGAMFFETAEEYVIWDTKNKLDYYYKHGGRMSETVPPLTWFPNEDIRSKALSSICLVCTHPEHAGDRLLYPGQYYENNRRCKECRRRDQRAPAISYSSAEEWVKSHASSNPKPKECEFTDKEEYKKALLLHKDRRVQYMKNYHARDDVKAGKAKKQSQED